MHLNLELSPVFDRGDDFTKRTNQVGRRPTTVAEITAGGLEILGCGAKILGRETEVGCNRTRVAITEAHGGCVRMPIGPTGEAHNLTLHGLAI